VLRVLAKARRLQPPLRAATFETLFGLLAATGMRIGEALTLTRDDVDLDEGTLTIRHAKFDRMRLVPLHPSVTAALRKYAAARDRRCRTRRTDRFFVSATGCAISRHTPEEVFAKITGQLGLRTRTVHPRIHDLRHTFAVRTLIGWQRDGTDVPAMLPVLSTYLGHVEPNNTYWYLSATPELMQLAAARLEQRFGGQS
jgi:integrase